MSITIPRIVQAGILAVALWAMPLVSEAGGTCYSQTTYYSQGVYTIPEASYVTTITDTVTENFDFVVSGILQKGSGSFLIDHPLDPKNSLLYHSFVESPDAKNMYDGTVELDKNGEAIVTLPDYFEVLNKDFRYQLRPIGAPMPNLYIKSEIADNQFTIGGGVAGGRVSWQVTGTRHDPYILANPIVNEVRKGPSTVVDRGEFFFQGYEKHARFPTHTLTVYLRNLPQNIRDNGIRGFLPQE